jgi:hypothetical protein
LEIVPFVYKSNLTFSILLDETFELGSKYNLNSRQSILQIQRITILEALHGGSTLVSSGLHVLKILPWLISTIPLFSSELIKSNVTGVIPVYHKNNYKTAGFQIEASKMPKPT